MPLGVLVLPHRSFMSDLPFWALFFILLLAQNKSPTGADSPIFFLMSSDYSLDPWSCVLFGWPPVAPPLWHLSWHPHPQCNTSLLWVSFCLGHIASIASATLYYLWFFSSKSVKTPGVRIWFFLPPSALLPDTLLTTCSHLPLPHQWTSRY